MLMLISMDLQSNTHTQEMQVYYIVLLYYLFVYLSIVFSSTLGFWSIHTVVGLGVPGGMVLKLDQSWVGHSGKL